MQFMVVIEAPGYYSPFPGRTRLVQNVFDQTVAYGLTTEIYDNEIHPYAGKVTDVRQK